MDLSARALVPQRAWRTLDRIRGVDVCREPADGAGLGVGLPEEQE